MLRPERFSIMIFSRISADSFASELMITWPPVSSFISSVSTLTATGLPVTNGGSPVSYTHLMRGHRSETLITGDLRV